MVERGRTSSSEVESSGAHETDRFVTGVAFPVGLSACRLVLPPVFSGSLTADFFLDFLRNFLEFLGNVLDFS